MPRAATDIMQDILFAAVIDVLSEARELPLPVFGDQEYPEDIRLTYRFLDLRRDRADLELFALRAVANRPLRQLRRVTADPAGSNTVSFHTRCSLGTPFRDSTRKRWPCRWIGLRSPDTAA